MGLLNTKSPVEFLAPLLQYSKSLTAIEILDSDSSFSANEILEAAKKIGFQAKTAKSISTAIRKIITEEKLPSMILICGSLYLAGNILKENK